MSQEILMPCTNINAMIKPRSLTQNLQQLESSVTEAGKSSYHGLFSHSWKVSLKQEKIWYICWLINSSRAFTSILAAIQPLHSNSNDGTMTRQKSIQVHPCINNWSWRVVECSSQITAGGNWTPLNMHCTDDRNETLLVSNSMAFLMKSTEPYFIMHGWDIYGWPDIIREAENMYTHSTLQLKKQESSSIFWESYQNPRGQ